MKSASLALAAVLTFAASGAHAQMLKLTQPADLNKDGVVTDAERAEYEANKGGPAPWDQPSTFSVYAPPSAGQGGVTFGEGPQDFTAQPRLEDRAVKASGFEEYINAEAEQNRRN
ncbi:MAG: hypothetical protein LPJ86_10240 [Caulobacteraceae bacterium]|nr:hypothetical protein [Caulobacteraceae bacterium]